MTGLADVDGFINLYSSVHVAGLPTPEFERQANKG